MTGEVGAIRKLVLFAGPSASGKSTFLAAPDSFLSPESSPAHLAAIHDGTVRRPGAMGLRLGGVQVVDRLLVQTDLSVPLRRMEARPQNRDQLLSALTQDLFASWERLQELTARAATIDVVTFFVRREQHFTRWARRGLMVRPNGSFNKFVTLVNSDPTNNSELHRRFYRSWHDWVRDLNPRSIAILDGTHEPYRFIAAEDLESELDSGYKTSKT